MENKTKNTVPLWAFIFSVAIMMAFSAFSVYIAVHGYMNDMAIGRSNQVYSRSEHPYFFWIKNGLHVIGGIMLFIFAFWISNIRYKQFKLPATAKQ